VKEKPITCRCVKPRCGCCCCCCVVVCAKLLCLNECYSNNLTSCIVLNTILQGKVPVAKRNFRNRHKHGNLFEKGKKESKEETPDGLANEEEEGGKEKASAAIPKLPLSEGGEKPPPKENRDVKLNSAPQSEEEATVNKVPFSAAATDPSRSIGTVSVSSMHNATKVRKWVELLENKPATGDKQAMAIWMLNLMNATDSSEGGVVVASPARMNPVAEAQIPASKIALSPVVELPVGTAARAKDSPVNKGMATSIHEGGKHSTDENNQEEEDRVDALISKAGAKRSEGIRQEAGEDDSTSSGLSQPPKKKFKQEYEEV